MQRRDSQGKLGPAPLPCPCPWAAGTADASGAAIERYLGAPGGFLGPEAEARCTEQRCTNRAVMQRREHCFFACTGRSAAASASGSGSLTRGPELGPEHRLFLHHPPQLPPHPVGRQGAGLAGGHLHMVGWRAGSHGGPRLHRRGNQGPGASKPSCSGESFRGLPDSGSLGRAAWRYKKGPPIPGISRNPSGGICRDSVPTLSSISSCETTHGFLKRRYRACAHARTRRRSVRVSFGLPSPPLSTPPPWP